MKGMFFRGQIITGDEVDKTLDSLKKLSYAHFFKKDAAAMKSKTNSWISLVQQQTGTSINPFKMMENNDVYTPYNDILIVSRSIHQEATSELEIRLPYGWLRKDGGRFGFGEFKKDSEGHWHEEPTNDKTVLFNINILDDDVFKELHQSKNGTAVLSSFHEILKASTHDFVHSATIAISPSHPGRDIVKMLENEPENNTKHFKGYEKYSIQTNTAIFNHHRDNDLPNFQTLCDATDNLAKSLKDGNFSEQTKEKIIDFAIFHLSSLVPKKSLNKDAPESWSASLRDRSNALKIDDYKLGEEVLHHTEITARFYEAALKEPSPLRKGVDAQIEAKSHGAERETDQQKV